MKSTINSKKIRLDCSSDDECKIQEFGKKICGGPVGTFVYSQRSEDYKALQDEIAKFNLADEAFLKKWNKDLFGQCDWSGRDKPAKCIENRCI